MKFSVKSRRGVAVIVLAACVIAAAVWYRRNSGIEPFVDYRGNSANELAIEREVIEAELADHGRKLIPALRDELRRGNWRRSRPWARILA